MTDDVDRVREVLDRFRTGWEALDAAVVLSCFDDSDATTVIGTDVPEYWRTYAEMEAPFRAMADAFTEPEYRWVVEPRITVVGDVAWADGVLSTRLTAQGAEVSADLRSTWVLARRDDGWKVAQAHFSVAADAPVAGY
jgi:ketosteroid isomerase-like protein